MDVLVMIVAAIVTVIAVGLFVRTVVGFVRQFKVGKSIKRTDKPAARTLTLLKEVFLATRLKQKPVGPIVAASHLIVLIAFGVLFFTLVTAYGQLINPDFALPLIGHWPPFSYLIEILSWLMVLAIVILIVVRLTRRPNPEHPRKSRFFGSTMWQAYYVEITILAIGIFVLALRAAEYARGSVQGEEFINSNFPLTGWIGENWTGLSLDALATLIMLLAFGKILVSMAWFVTVAVTPTMGVAWHRFLAFFNVWFQRNANGKPALGQLEPIRYDGVALDFEKLDDFPDDIALGVTAMTDFSWKALLDFSTCTECGRCQSQCPAWNTEKPLSPKLFTIAMRNHAHAISPWMTATEEERAALDPGLIELAEKPLVGDDGVIADDILWSCTTCGACVNQCPVDIAHIDHIVDIRRSQVLVQSEFPTELNGLFKNVENKGNPWGMNASGRNDWISEVDFDVKVFGMDGEDTIPEDIDYLFWVGCAGAYEDRAKRTTKNVAELMNIAGVSFMVLGEGETCTGDPARRAGNEFLFQMQAAQNIEVLNEIKATKIVVTCPHCLNALKREYPQLGGNYEVVHHTELLNDLVKAGRLTPVNKIDQTVTYHDPCYLGRHNQVYNPPRELIGATADSFVEMDRNRDKSFCCGAGGARMWMEEKLGTRINQTRGDEAIATGAKRIAVGCPFCSVMLNDAVNTRQQEPGRAVGVEVVDVSTLLLNAAKS